MDDLTLGILAHVDAGKTTLSEALLYTAGAVRKLGRVDHADAFLDTDALEKERGITIFAKQAVLETGDVRVTLLDTPGHADFSAEAQRTLGVLDAAVLVISAPDGVRSHTLSLWRLLRRAGVPTLLFLNKLDQPGVDPAALEEALQSRLSPACLSWAGICSGAAAEEAALTDEDAMEEYLSAGALSQNTLRRLFAQGRLFPCFYGSALKLERVKELLSALPELLPRPVWGGEFAAKVFKISRDQGQRLTHLRITGGALRVKDVVNGEKADQLRIYSGAKFTAPEAVSAGTVCAVTGLSSTYPGQALGAQEPWAGAIDQPPLAYQLFLPREVDPHAALPRLLELGEEDPQLDLGWDSRLGGIQVRLMGEVQAEILQRLILDRFGWAVTFGPGRVVYRETIAAPVEGVGHFEPLRHYAEVHLLLEPLPPGSGVELATVCPTDQLAVNWQRLILTHLAEKPHLGVLTGSPITDVRITLLSGKAHEKHTEGGDFRQATYRAVRQGLMGARSVLLEPWYAFRLELPAGQLGRALGDLQRMGGETDAPQTLGEEAVLTGFAPVSGLRDYAAEVAAYTRGQGRLSCESAGCRPCADQEKIVSELGYDPERDVDNPAGSIFCSHGAGHEVPWDEVPRCAHLPMLASQNRGEETAKAPPSGPQKGPSAPLPGGLEQDKELLDIFQRTYGAVKPRSFDPAPKPRRTSLSDGPVALRETAASGPEYLLVDGYNILFAWPELKALAQENLDAARKALMDLLSNYQGFRKNRVILVFDAYKVPQGTGSVVKYHNIHVVYTKEAETADSYIEKASYQLSKEKNRVRVATSDAAEQFIILGHGALRVSAQELWEELSQTRGEIDAILRRNNLKLPDAQVRSAFERAREKGRK